MGRRGGGSTPEQQAAEKRKTEELAKLKGIEEQKTRAAGRRTRGRASLISGSEGGIGGASDFAALNLGTKTRLGVEEKERKEQRLLDEEKLYSSPEAKAERRRKRRMAGNPNWEQDV